MAGYTYIQYAEMILINGECQTNAKAAAKFYSERFSRDQHPTKETITDALHRLRQNSSVAQPTNTSKRQSKIFEFHRRRCWHSPF